MSKEVPWRRVLVEGVVIVGSILLALGLEAWWAERSERVDEQSALVRVHDELVAEREILVAFESLHRASASTSLSLFNVIDDLDAGSGTIGIRDRELASLVRNPTYETQTPTLDALLRSGGIDVISDVDVRAAIARWESRLRDAWTSEAEAGRFINTQMVPALISRGDIGHVLLSAQRTRILELDADGVTNVRFDPELKALIAQRQSTAALVLLGLESARTSLDNAVTVITGAIGR